VEAFLWLERPRALEQLFKKQSLCASLMSNSLRRMQRNSPILIFLPDLDSFWSNGRLPTPKERADALILWIGDNQSSPEWPVSESEPALDAWTGSALPPVPGSATGLRWLVEQITNQNLFTHSYLGGKAKFSLTFGGWERYAALKISRKESRTSRFVIADLTHGSAGAYWEAGFGEGLGLPVIYSCEKTAWEKQKTHFDTNHYKTILWDLSNLRNAGDELTATIRATLRTEAKLTDD
jgi:hypothetical protein